MEKITTLGRSFFAIAMVASGIQQLINADFVRLVPKLPAWIPWHPFWACLVGVILIVAGWAVILGKSARWAATVLGGMFLVTFLFQRVPEIISNPLAGFMWTNPCKVLALLGGALIVAGIPPGGNVGKSSAVAGLAGKLQFLGPVSLGVFLLVCGIQHFVYAAFVDTLVPVWMPPGLRFWTYFTGTALIAGGVGILLPKTVRWAAMMSGVMIFLWVLLLHIPRAVADPHNAGETSAIFEALALSGVCFLVAGTRAKRVG